MLKIHAKFLIILFVLFLGVSCKGHKLAGPKDEQNAKIEMDKFANAYAKNHQMEVINIGNFTQHKLPFIYGIWVRDFSEKTLDEGRKSALALVDSFWNEIQNNQKLRFHFDCMHKFMPQKYPNPLSLQYIGIRIAYWDKNVLRPIPPYVAMIEFYESKFYYYQADPETQGLRLVHEESYEEAVKQQSQSKY